MSKRTYGHVLVLPSQRLVRPASDDDFVVSSDKDDPLANAKKFH